MQIYFFDVQPWEKEFYTNYFPAAHLIEEQITEENARTYSDATIISTFIQSKVTPAILDALPNLKLITTRSTGYDHIHTEAAKAKNIAVTNVPEYGSATVAEHAFALLLTLTRKVYQSVLQLKNPDFTHANLTGTDLYGKTFGVVGLGKIGLHVMQIARGFGMRVLVYNRTVKEELAQTYGFEYASLPLLLSQSDVVSLHLAFSPQTKHTINMQNITLFKKGAYLINTARGALVETEAIVYGLQNDILAGVGLDVLEEEQELLDELEILTPQYATKANLKNLVYDHMLLHHPNVVITPHNAFNSAEALQRIGTTTLENIHSFLSGNLINRVV